jgi:dihydrodipicolinate synthase/N-acetylneuraminate lyase
MTTTTFAGVYPIAPTTFAENGDVDIPSQKRCIDYMIDAGVNGICILANYSEQFTLTDDEREQLTTAIIDHVAGRVPVIVTTTHFGTRIAAERSKRAQQAGAAMVMLMPPYHGATLRANDAGVETYFKTVADAIDIPIMIQDAPISGVTLTVELLAKMAREIPQVSYIKAEMPGAADKLRALIAAAGDALAGPFDGEESITLIPDLDAGATGTMPSAMVPDALRLVCDRYRMGQRDAAIAVYERWLPLINFENKQCGLRATKTLMAEGGIIASDAVRHPITPLHPGTRAGLVELAKRLDALILRWAK